MSKAKRDISRLPKWAQEEIADRDRTIIDLYQEKRRLETAHAVLDGKAWFTIPGPKVEREIIKLWYLCNDSPVCLCSLGNGDTLLIGRKESKP